MHKFTIRVYYEDTDAGGIVYYANYLKFIERARSEWVRACGVSLRDLHNDAGLKFVVRRVEADYLRPALFDDQLHVTTTMTELGGARVELDQTVWRGEDCLFKAEDCLFKAHVVMVCANEKGAVRIPPAVRAAFSASIRT